MFSPRSYPAALALLLSLLSVSFAGTTASEEPRWPYNLPRHVKYYPEDEPLVRRNEIAQQKLQNEKVVGVKKMSLDEGEMFFPEYWTFESDAEPESVPESIDSDIIRRREHNSGDEELKRYENSSMTETVWPVFALHSEQQSSEAFFLGRFFARQLEKRFQCPTGTSACTSINRPNACCATDETCQIIQDTGLGDVGCCPSGETCSGSVSTCQSGYSSCPSGGGCCIPGYECYGTGCAKSLTATVAGTSQTSSTDTGLVTIYSTTTVIVYPSATSSSTSTSTSTSTSAATSTSTFTTATTVVASTDSVVVTTTIIYTTSALASSSTSTSLTCSSSYRSCPASLGGGCCPTDRACGSPTCPALSSTESVSAAVRATGDATSTTTTSTSTSESTSNASVCPTGYYACIAYYPHGGCCRIGRDCSSTSCPASDSTTLISTNAVTVVAASTTGLSATVEGETGTCATGWSLCPTSDGGGCCPNGYACGSSCTIESAATQTGYGTLVQKIQPSSAARIVCLNSFWTLFTIMASMNIFWHFLL